MIEINFELTLVLILLKIKNNFLHKEQTYSKRKCMPTTLIITSEKKLFLRKFLKWNKT